MRQAALRRAFEALHAGRFEAAWAEAGGLSGFDPADPEASLLAGLALGGWSAHADAAQASTRPGIEGASGPELAQRSAALLSAVAAARPRHAHPCLDLLGLLRRQRLQGGYGAVLHACLARAPEDPRLRRALAELQHDDGDDAGALDTIAAWLALRPGDEAALGLRGTVLASLGRAEEALAQFHALAKHSPGTARHWTNLGNTLRLLGRLDEAVPALRRAAGLAPGDGQIRLNHAVALLHAGHMDAGWREYEARLSLPGHTPLPHARLLPALAGLPGGHAALRGCTVLCTHEEGFGDTLQFARFLPLLASAGAHVVVQAPPPLVRLLRSLGPGVEVVEDGAALPAWDWHCPMLSLPRVFGTTLDTIPSATPYLHAHPAAILAAEARLARVPGADRALRVGLAWAGQSRPWQPGFAAIDRRRSIGLAALAPLGALSGVSLVGLQFGPEAAQAGAVAGLALHDGVADARDFADTAAVVSCLDVVVSVDTAVVHLAGALGRPVLMLDRFDACWRWLHGRDDSPWYPGLRIVRQERPGDWGGVVARVAAMLRDMAAAREQGRPKALPLDSAQGSP
ncbi:MAG: tetratricopeptide repeat protein [Janthinobacterium lividum]